MDIENIRLLIRVVDLGSVQLAARELGIPRSTLRRRLDELEAEVGAALLAPGPAGVALTPAGEVVLGLGRRLLESVSVMVNSARTARGEMNGTVRIITPLGQPVAGRVLIARMVQSLAPGLCLEEVELPDPLKALHERFDIMFHFGPPPERGHWYSRVLKRFNLMPLATEEYLQETGRPTSVADLARHRLLHWRLDDTETTQWPLRAGGHFLVNPAVCSRSGQMMHTAASSGLGILLGNPLPVDQDLPNNLVPVLEDVVGREETLRCLSPVPTDRDPRTRVVVESILDFLGEVTGAGN